MGTSVDRELTVRERARMPEARQEMLNAGTRGCATKFTYLAAFDGTRNDRDHRELAGVDEVTNIAKLASQAETSSKSTPDLTFGYFKGVGTGGDQGGIVNAGVAPSLAIEAAAQSAYLRFRNEALDYLERNKRSGATTADIGAAAIGFSRGSAAAIRFAQLVNEKGLSGPGGEEIIPPGKVPVTGLALIDPVARFVDQPMDIPPNVQGQVLSVVADHETRADFRPLHYANDPRVTEVRHPGNHVGVGGGYDRNGTAANVLEGVTGYLQQRGVQVTDVAPDNRHRADAPQKIYSEAYQTAHNGDVMTDEAGKKQLAWRVDDPEKGRVLATPKMSEQHKQVLRQSMTELSPGLKAHGLSPEQCLQVSAACTVCAARHQPDWGDPRRFLVSKDGEKVAVQHQNGRFDEVRVDQALERSAVSHLRDLQGSERTPTQEAKTPVVTPEPAAPALERTP
ncbi:hypothetical protein [Hydrogenophaga sp. RWCD_12]|uniref:hypothetical protein n=1 Tax=Hydrogenophaga sp. RWCD_12 TaxID=3391190 RepID=UPI003984BFF6